MTIPMSDTLRSQTQPFDDPDWVFELKHDGFRALAIVEHGKARFVSRNGSRIHGFVPLAIEVSRTVRTESAILDGEIALPHETGPTIFARLMEHREQARFYAFDLLWLNGEDLRALPLLTRQQHLKVLLRRRSPWLIYVDHVMEHGRTLFQLACREDLDGVLHHIHRITPHVGQLLNDFRVGFRSFLGGFIGDPQWSEQTQHRKSSP